MRIIKKIDIVLSIYNQENIIDLVLWGIFANTTTPFNLILVFDGCTDKSQTKTLSYIKKYRPNLLEKVIVRVTNNIYETKANNVGFKLAREEFMITLQDDMIIKERGWEKRLTCPLRLFDDVLAVTSRHAQDIEEINLNIEKYTNRAARELNSLPRNIFAVRDVINRGPIAFRVKYLKKLNYLDEKFAPCNLDEADLALKAWLKYKWKVGSFWIDYLSPLKYGKSRQEDSTMNTVSSEKKNRLIIYNRYHNYLQLKEKHSENILVTNDCMKNTSRINLISEFKRVANYPIDNYLDSLMEKIHKLPRVMAYHILRIIKL